MPTEWTVDGLVLELAARDGPAARARAHGLVAVASMLTGALLLGLILRPAPAPVCLTAALCRAHLPADVNPDPPEESAYVTARVAEVLDAVRTEDRLPADVDVVDHLSTTAPDVVEWAFLAAEHAEHGVIAESPRPGGLALKRREALAAYRAEAGQERVHFQDDTRFVAEIQAVRSAVDRREARARLDALTARNRSVLDLGTASARHLVAASTDLAAAEWRTRRLLEQIRLGQVTERLAQGHTRAEVAWLFGMVLGGVAWLVALFTASGAVRGARRASRPVRIEITSRGIRLDGRWLQRAAIVWVSLRDGRLRVVTRDDDLTSRAVVDDRALHAALREWRRLSEPDDGLDPDGEARVRRLLA